MWRTFISMALVLVGCSDDPHDTTVSHFEDAGIDEASAVDADTLDAAILDASRVDASTGDERDETPLVTCLPVTTSEIVPARDLTNADVATPLETAIFTADVFGRFKSTCGACHVDTNRGGFQVKNAASFAAATADRQTKIADRIQSDDPDSYMPPPGQPNSKAWSHRSANDGVVALLKLLQQWFAAGSPPDLFYPTEEGAGAASVPASYSLPANVGAALTNLGNCVPNKVIVGRDSSKMDALDAFFASATELPAKLEQTDLVTFDSETLARQGVVSISPAYPLFSDNARKMRHLRVPRGKSLVFDKETQEFTIPDNTRVYKTFLKSIVDKNGNERFRKMETRLIVSRPDGPDDADGAHETRSLFGTYAWNEGETEATLVTDPLRNGKPFQDRLVSYVIDERKAEEVLATEPYNKVIALRDAKATRSYAIPGSERCIECHMGSHNRSFVLGLTPLQLNRRSPGQGGVYEAASADELSQLQRLIDYKLITGISSLSDVLPLESSQTAPARNDYELSAQGYMLGNCAHCHNPRGYPTIQNPELRDLLRFFPDKAGGIFQFPLDRVSPRIKRGAAQTMDIAYITPSLFDLEEEAKGGVYAQKHINTADYLAAPWRSLIYRNVDTPFAFSEDYTLYPHMPMNVPGFDCRAPRIFADWMVSIPAVLRTDTLDQSPAVETTDPRPQLYVESKPSDANYDAAIAAAKRRLNAIHIGGALGPDLQGRSYGAVGFSLTSLAPFRALDYCPNTSDIVDPDVPVINSTPADLSSLPSLAKQLAKDDSLRAQFAQANDGVPDRPHWVPLDSTDAPGAWYPRRSDWSSVLVKNQVDAVDAAQKKVVGMLRNVTLSDAFRAYALRPVPFGLWKEKPGCDFSNTPTVGAIPAEDLPRWVGRYPYPAKTAPVFYQSPGAAVFNEICVNCHGPKFDSRGRQAEMTMLMSGGDTRVANLRDGLLGPVESPGDNRARVFGEFATSEVSADDWAARYVAWMGLGGTQRKIPISILNVVGSASVLGEVRKLGSAPSSANMLAIAQSFCAQTLGRNPYGSGGTAFDVTEGLVDYRASTGLIAANGDAELWQKLCAFENAPPVRVVQATSRGFFITSDLGNGTSAWYRASSYPQSAQVGNERGGLSTGVQPDNLAPWCVQVATGPSAPSSVEGLPICPPTWLLDQNKLDAAAFEEWTLRGAMNGGFAVFLYLDQLARDALQGKGPSPAFNRCEALKP